MTVLQEAIETLRRNLEDLPLNMVNYNMGYAAAINDLEHIVEIQTAKCICCEKDKTVYVG